MSADASPARWPRLLSEDHASEYLSISRTTLRELPIPARRIGRRRLYDLRDLDRFVDGLNDLPAGRGAAGMPEAEAVAAEERRFFEERKRRGRN